MDTSVIAMVVGFVSAAVMGGLSVMDAVSTAAHGFSGAVGSGSGIVGTTSAVHQVLASLCDAIHLPSDGLLCGALWQPPVLDRSISKESSTTRFFCMTLKSNPSLCFDAAGGAKLAISASPAGVGGCVWKISCWVEPSSFPCLALP